MRLFYSSIPVLGTVVTPVPGTLLPLPGVLEGVDPDGGVVGAGVGDGGVVLDPDGGVDGVFGGVVGVLGAIGRVTTGFLLSLLA